MGQSVLKVGMLGAFTMEYEGHPIAFERNTMTKTNQLMQILLFAGEKGVKRETLLQQLFGREEVTNPSNSLRATVFRLRKLLTEAGLPEDEYIHIKCGNYRWTEAIPVELDVVWFEKLAKQALAETQEERCIELLESVCALYHGDFLAALSGEAWVAMQIAKYKNIYIECMNKLCTLLKTRGDFERLYQIAEQAVALYPYDEWQIWQMESLIAQNRPQDAMKLYEETADLLFRGIGVLPSENMRACLSKLDADTTKVVDPIEEIQESLKEQSTSGALYSSYPGFIENYRYVKRMIERTGQSAYLLLCTLTDGKGQPLEKGERIEVLSEELSEAIRGALRRGDLYTRYSINQYLILLLDLDTGDCAAIIDRINGTFENPTRKNYIKYHVASVNEETDK